MISRCEEHRGFSTKLQLQCRACDYKSEHVYSSPYKEDDSSSSFEINTVMTIIVHELGKGHAVIIKFSNERNHTALSISPFSMQAMT